MAAIGLEDLFNQSSFAELDELQLDDTGEPPENALQREMRKCQPLESFVGQYSVDEARELIIREGKEYLRQSDADYMLLFNAAPGTGKTYAGIKLAEMVAMQGRRVAYAGPRHNFFDEIIAISDHPEMWFEWQPRKDGDEEGNGQTCMYSGEINGWLNKGYEGLEFCKGVCGWAYMKECPYHLQKKTKKPIIYIQHAHVTMGHPIDNFSILIGDENPMDVFLHKWQIKSGSIVPGDMVMGNGVYEILTGIKSIAEGLEKNEYIYGYKLMDALGGEDNVLRATKDFAIPAAALAYTSIRNAEEAALAPAFHLPRLLPLLIREAKLAKAMKPYIPRIVIGKKNMVLYLRRDVEPRMPKKRIWLDATGNQHIYETLFRQRVRTIFAYPKMIGNITVVSDSTNGKFQHGIVAKSESIVKKLMREKGYKKPAIVSYKSLLDDENEEHFVTEGFDKANFYGARGSNMMQNADVLFIIGTPMPFPDEITYNGRMIYFERDLNFTKDWSNQYMKYNFRDEEGYGREYPAGGFWQDTDLAALLWQVREAEIIQAVHRARPILHDVDIYLFTNLPIAELEVKNIVTSSEIIDAPKGIDAYRWQAFENVMRDRSEITIVEMCDVMRMDRRYARDYFKNYSERNNNWSLEYDRPEGRGRPMAVLRRTE